jgi:hypothetical protein
MCIVWSKRPLRFLHDLPKAHQLQQARLSPGAVVELACNCKSFVHGGAPSNALSDTPSLVPARGM